MKKKINFLQPLIPHYRDFFFIELNKLFSVNVFCPRDSSNKFFRSGSFQNKFISSFKIWKFFFYNPFPLFKENPDVIILMFQKGDFTTWILLITKIFHRKKIVLWGHGISIPNYFEEEMSPNFFLKLMAKMADSLWLYTSCEKKIWDFLSINNNIISLNNTLVVQGSDLSSSLNVNCLKNKYGIKETFIFIISIRFTNPFRRIDLLLDAIHELSNDKFGFIIIGDGNLKPDFSSFLNVYDFGAVYDPVIKSELFTIADIYFQPAWLGLSIVEALGFSLPIFTFERSEKVLQCVEYSYVVNLYNGLIFSNFKHFIDYCDHISSEELSILSVGAQVYYQNNLLPSNMINSASISLNILFNK